MRALFAPLLIIPALFLGTAWAQDEANDDEAALGLGSVTCQDMFDLFEEAAPGDDQDPEELQNAQDDALYFVVWVHGYLSGRNGLDLEQRPLNKAGIERIVGDLAAVCEDNLDALVVDQVDSIE